MEGVHAVERDLIMILPPHLNPPAHQTRNLHSIGKEIRQTSFLHARLECATMNDSSDMLTVDTSCM
jgi:hypothetical protein